MITFNQKGDFKKTHAFLKKMRNPINTKILDKYGEEGVAALSSATPKDTGLTASSWYYKIENKDDVISVIFCNRNIQNGTPIAIILQYGHGTATGGYVKGRDYINPAIQPIFDEMAKNAWKEVVRK